MKETSRTHIRRAIFGISILAFPFQATHAKEISEAEARAIATSFNAPKSALSTQNMQGDMSVKRFMTKSGETALYVFTSVDTNDFVIVSGDDETAGPILGYGNNFQSGAGLPPAFNYWIEQLSEQVEYISACNATSYNALTATTSSGSYTPVEPLLGNTAWDQGSPYNNSCPEKSGVRCVTGCVATSIAQIMRYWEYPTVGKGSWEYEWNGSTLSRDFSSSQYDWENMPLRYTSSSTDTAKQCVASLMYDIGVAVSMDYGTSESAATTQASIYALYNNFGYDATMQLRERSFYSIGLWEATLRNELQAGRPVIYAGQSSEGGHQFVCDGYDADGYFHFNWGWSGMCDGYFLTSALVPEGSGTGGYSRGYNYNQTIITGIEPAKGRSAENAFTCFGHGLGSSDGYTYTLVVNGYSFIPGEVEIDLGYAASVSPIVDVATSKVHKSSTVTVNPTIPARSSGLIYSMVIANGSNTFDPVSDLSLSDGEYYITPVYKPSHADEWEVLPCGTHGFINIDVNNKSVEVVPLGSSEIDLLTLDVPHEMKIGRTADIRCELRAVNRDFDGPVSFTINSTSGDTIAMAGTQLLQLSAGESRELTLPIEIPLGTPAGKYNSKLSISGSDPISGISIDVISSPVNLDSENFPDRNLLNLAKEFDSDGDGILSDTELYNATALDAQSKGISDASGIENLFALKQLYFDDNDLTMLNLSGLDRLEVLGISNNSLSEIDFTPTRDLFYVRCAGNEISSIDVSQLTKLQSLDITDNPIMAIDLSLNDALSSFAAGSKATIHVGSDRTAELTDIPGMDAQNISDLQGAELSGTTMKFTGSEASYKYKTGNDMFPEMPVTLAVVSSSGSSEYPDVDSMLHVIGMTAYFSDNAGPLQIIDMEGRVIASGQLSTVPLPSPGIYIISGANISTKISAR